MRRTLPAEENATSASVLARSLSRGLVTGKRAVLLTLSRLCGRVCIILLIPMKTLLADRGARCLRAAAMSADRFEVSVTFDERRGYVASAARSALARDGALARRPAPAHRGAYAPADLIITLSLDRSARRERDRQATQARALTFVSAAPSGLL
jgi:hypothetical protein